MPALSLRRSPGEQRLHVFLLETPPLPLPFARPIRLVRQSAKRERAPDVLTAEEIKALLAELDGPYFVMAFLAAVTGLRVSELTALKWADVDFVAGEMRLSSGALESAGCYWDECCCLASAD